MKTKSNVKILLLVAILLITMCLFSTNMVQATETTPEETEQVITPVTQEESTTDETYILTETTPTKEEKVATEESTQTTSDITSSTQTQEITSTTTENEEISEKIAKLIPNNIKVSLKEIQYEELWNNENNEIVTQITNTLKSNNIDTTNYVIAVYAIHEFDIYNYGISIIDKTTHADVVYKEIKVQYSNTSSWNEQDKSIAEKVAEGFNNAYYYWTLDEEGTTDADFLKKKMEDYEKILNSFISEEGVSMKMIMTGRGNGLLWCEIVGEMMFFKDDVLYTHKNGSFVCRYGVTIPENIEDTDEAYINYAFPEIKKWLTKKANDFDPSKLTLEKNTGIWYTLLYEGQYAGDFAIQKENTFKIHDRITMAANSNVTLAAEEIDKKLDTYTEMKNKLSEKGYTDIFNAYELKLKSGNIGDGLELTFDLGTENNGKQAIILHKKQDGTYEEFIKTIENGRISIIVKELSPFMVAIKDAEATRLLDNEPKTGVADYTIFASMIVLISLGGITILKFKK